MIFRSVVVINKFISIVFYLMAQFFLANQAFSSTYTPSYAYKIFNIDGFVILVSPELISHDEEYSEAIKELKSQLANIGRVMPSKQLSALKQVKIWLEWRANAGAAEFHPSAEWLSANGYNPEKAGGIEISNAVHFIEWSRADQPWMLLHEMSHAYHNKVLGDNYEAIKYAYKNSVNLKLYDSVSYIHGGNKKAYAMNNEKEYFAEISEAYFGKNDFYPYIKSELAVHDPVGYQLMINVWGYR